MGYMLYFVAKYAWIVVGGTGDIVGSVGRYVRDVVDVA